MALTAAGKRLVGEAQKLLSAAQALRNEARAIKGEVAGVARVGTVSDPQFIRVSDLMGVAVSRPKVTETTALGAAYLAGLAAGVWKDPAEIARQREIDRVFEPRMPRDTVASLRARWANALERSRGWETA
jgi:glycerol kinase